MDGGDARLHILEVVTALSLRRARRQPTRAGQLCWARIWRIHRRCTTASSSRRRGGIRLGGWRRSGYTYNGHQGYPQSTVSNDGGAAEARTRMAGVCTLPDWDNLPGRVTRLL